MINQAITAHQEGRLKEAEQLYQSILENQPTNLVVNNNLGIILHNLGRFDEATASYKKAIELKPDYAEAHHNLGITLQKLKRLDEATASYKKAIKLKPNYAEAYNNLGIILQKLNKFDEAETSIRKAIELKANFAEAHNILGITLFQLDRFDEAEASYKKAIELKTDYAEAYHNLGNILSSSGNKEASLINHQRAYDLKPDIDFLLGSLIRIKMQLCIWDDLPHDLDLLTKKVNNKEKVVTPFSLLSLIDEPTIHRKAAEINSNNFFSKSDIFPKILPYHNHKKIKLGYFSPDFRNHPISSLTAELYEIHDRSKFEIHAFSFGPNTKDELNIRVKAGVDYFHDVQMMSNHDVVKLARSLEIDIAIDLAGFTGQARQSIFAMSAAAIQVNYLGYAGTMCANYMNYVIVDRIVVPENQKKNYLEKIVYLPNSYMPNDSKTKVSKKSFTRKDFGLPDTGFVFCSFNKHYKISPTTFASWMNILSKVEGSVLWLSHGNMTIINNLKKEVKKIGIHEDRLIFAPYLSLKEDHLSRIKLADLFIDTLPYNAHATASDALRMGLPLLTCIGNSYASRVTASLLEAVNLPEMITSTQEEYEALAIQLAKNPEKLKTIKDKLNSNLTTAPLYDTSLYAQNLEAAYQIMYKRYQDGLDPDDIEIHL